VTASFIKQTLRLTPSILKLLSLARSNLTTILEQSAYILGEKITIYMFICICICINSFSRFIQNR
jgi:hypothetical protein